MKKELKCSACGITNETHLIVKLRYEDVYYCEKHREQLSTYGKIKDNIKPNIVPIYYCSICGDSSLDKKIYKDTKYGKPLCQRHQIQFSRYGEFIERTIREPNEYIYHDDYCEILVYDKNGKEKSRTKIDLEDVDKIKQYKIYERNGYFRASTKGENGKKLFLHRIIKETTFNVDHINHDTSDNRKSNLRIVTTQQNTMNMDKGIDKGVIYKASVDRYFAQIMLNYKGIWLGIYDTKEEALIARFIADVVLFKDFRHTDFDIEKIKILKQLSEEKLSNIVDNIKKCFAKNQIKHEDIKECLEKILNKKEATQQNE